MAPSLLFVLAGFLASTSSLSLVKHALPDVPAGWAEISDSQLSPVHGLQLRFGLAQPGFSQLEYMLRHTSDPTHPSYGKHLSKQEVHALTKPPNATIKMVEDWLTRNNASSLKWSYSQDSVSAVVPVSTANDMLSSRFGVFEHSKTGKRVVRTLSYSLPEDLLEHITFVHPTTAFLDPLRHGMGRFAADPADPSTHLALEKRPVALNQSDFTSCVSIVDPPCVRRLYNIGNYTPDASLNNHIGVAGYLDIWARPDSLTLYLNDYVPQSRGSNYTFNVVNITGPFTPISYSTEGNVDTQMAIQVAYPIPMTYYTTNSVPPYIPDQNQDGEVPGVNEPYLQFIEHLLDLDDANLPTVVTTSYGDDEQTVPKDYAIAVCQGFAKLGARGVSVLFSSGDQGLGVDDLPTCIANIGNNATTFLPVFPASCPYVTTVGQTSGFFSQVPLENSGAGFSYYFDRPWYQDSDVSRYLSEASKHETALQSSMYNHGGRAYPDLTCVGGGAFFDYYYGRWDIAGGTSVAVPTTASIVALLNDVRLRKGKPTLGFLNPFLYGRGSQGLVDITDGLVNGCEQPGFNATKGWDPASGLGFINFKKLKSLL
ncbi:tripeptidyl peptidase A [Mycena sp. CBHHK59/15]|nr:tripeptidyl peptidase A [Mycena sp. CBHHK59/15]